MVEDSSFPYVQPTERNGSEVDGPDIVGDLFKSYVFSSEQVGNVHPGLMPSNAAVGGNSAGLEMIGVIGRLDLLREGSG